MGTEETSAALASGGAVIGADGRPRCPWSVGNAVDEAYHDTEWGVRISGEAEHLERLSLEAFQSGLSWRTILLKRPAFREAFAGFDADAVAAFTEVDVERLMDDAAIVRNRRKIEATITNARATVALREQGGLETVIVAHAPVTSAPRRDGSEVPATSPESVALAKSLKRAGFAFVGPTTMYALMQAIGLVDDHVVGCHRHGPG